MEVIQCTGHSSANTRHHDSAGTAIMPELFLDSHILKKNQLYIGSPFDFHGWPDIDINDHHDNTTMMYIILS